MLIDQHFVQSGEHHTLGITIFDLNPGLDFAGFGAEGDENVSGGIHGHLRLGFEGFPGASAGQYGSGEKNRE